MSEALKTAEKHKTLEAIDILNGHGKLVNYLLFEKTYREIEEDERSEA